MTEGLQEFDAGAAATATFGVLLATLWGVQAAGADLTAPWVGAAIDGVLAGRQLAMDIGLTLLWSLVVASAVAMWALARVGTGRMTDRELLALGRSWFGGRSGLGRLGSMVRWTARVGMALFVVSLTVSGGGELARQLDEIRVGAEARKQSEAVASHGFAGAVGAQRQGKEEEEEEEEEEERADGRILASVVG